MSEKLVDAEGILGNFESRRRIEKEAAEARHVGRTRPRMRETTPGSRAWNEIHTDERLVDEKG
jgi:hypothetical protein